MGLTLSFLGRVADRWHVRIELEPGFRPEGLTLVLMSEAGRALGPNVVVPLDTDRCTTAALRGPATLPPGTRVLALADHVGGKTERFETVVDARRGLHAFLHGDGLLELESEPVGKGLTEPEIQRLSHHFPWLRRCCEDSTRRLDTLPPEDAGLMDMLRDEFGVDVDDLDDELVEALRR